MASKRRYPFLIIGSGVSLDHVSLKLLAKLNALGAALGKQITITSGYRSFAEQKYLWDHAKELGLVRGKTVAEPGHSDHQFGLAVDATIDGRSIGLVVSRKVMARYGLETKVAGDPPHVTMIGATRQSSSGDSTSPEPAPAPAAAPAQTVDVSAIPQLHPPSGPPDPSVISPPILQPASVPASGFSQQSLADTWRLIAASPLATPDVQTFLSRAEASSA